MSSKKIKSLEEFHTFMNICYEKRCIMIVFFVSFYRNPNKKLLPNSLFYKYYNSIRVYEIETETIDYHLLKMYFIESFPSVIFIKNKEMVDKIIGKDIDDIKSVLLKYFCF